MEYIAIALSLVAVILCIVILSKVNKVLDNLHTPIVKKLTPDMNLKPSSRRPVSAQEMAQRGERNNKDNRNKDRQNNKENRGENKSQAQQGQAQNRDRNEQRDNNRGQRRDRREGRPDRQRRENNAEAPAAEAPASVAPAAVAAEAPVAERRPLAPRIPVETPAAPAVEAPVAAPAAAPAVAEAEVAPVETTFDPAKVRYGRRNVIKKAPELSDEEA